MALAEEALKDKVIYRGFIDNSLDSDVDPLKTENFGETVVMLAPLGSTEGWNQKLNKAVEEIVDDEALKNIISNYEGDELLLDIDHRSMREPLQRSTEAAGWIRNLIAIYSDSPLAGLYGTIKWTETGRKLVEARDYRFLSPVFVIDDDNKPLKLVNCALTNRPAFTNIEPILNTATLEKDINQETISMTIDEIKEMINSCVDEKLKAVNAAADDKELKEEIKEEIAEEKKEASTPEEAKEEIKEEIAEEKAEAKAEDAYREAYMNTVIGEVKEEKKEDVVEEKVEAVEEKKDAAEDAEEKKEEKKEEIIKEEVLNSAPSVPAAVTSKLDGWKNLRGKDFIKWLDKHPTGV